MKIRMAALEDERQHEHTMRISDERNERERVELVRRGMGEERLNGSGPW